MGFLSNITVTCFFASYLVALVLEFTRPFFKLPARTAILIGCTAAGLFAHISFVVISARKDGDTGLLASWFDWSLLLGLGLAVFYLILLLRRPSSTLGYFLLPAVLCLIALAWLLRDSDPFSRVEAVQFWRSVHGLAMLMVTVTVLLGFLAGVMFLVQGYRLKHKQLATDAMRLPSLEWLQKLNRYCLFGSTVLMSVGLLSGVAMHLNKTGEINWTEGGVLLSCGLFAWLVAATFFELVYDTSKQGRKIAYLTLASFLFLVIVMASVIAGQHGSNTNTSVAKWFENSLAQVRTDI